MKNLTSSIPLITIRGLEIVHVEKQLIFLQDDIIIINSFKNQLDKYISNRHGAQDTPH